MKAVYLKELRTYFRNPLGYVFIAVIFAVFAVFYSIYTLYGGYASFGGTVLSSAAGLLSYLIPMLTMRSFAEESKNKTDQLLLTAPIRTCYFVYKTHGVGFENYITKEHPSFIHIVLSSNKSPKPCK